VLERNGTHFDPINVWVISQQFNTKTNSKLRACLFQNNTSGKCKYIPPIQCHNTIIYPLSRHLTTELTRLSPPPFISYTAKGMHRVHGGRTMHSSGTQNTDEAQSRLQKLIYTVWNLWKECCRCAFNNRAAQLNVLANVIQVDVLQ
jgi:hypothetical protein